MRGKELHFCREFFIVVRGMIPPQSRWHDCRGGIGICSYGVYRTLQSIAHKIPDTSPAAVRIRSEAEPDNEGNLTARLLGRWPGE